MEIIVLFFLSNMGKKVCIDNLNMNALEIEVEDLLKSNKNTYNLRSVKILESDCNDDYFLQ